MTQMLFGVAGGLALFIYGMNLMSEGLKKAAGEKLRKILEVLTKNAFMGALVGLMVTAIIQSSSATTVMIVGFVNAGLMTLPQAIGVVFGANIGTTMTAQLIAFDIGKFAPLIAFLGFGLYFIPKRKKTRYYGEVVFGFGVLFMGLNFMSSMLKPLAASPVFRHLIITLGKQPILGVLVGTAMTCIVQSSSATIGVLQSIAMQPVGAAGAALIPLKSAIPILFGDNIGTTITAWIATIGSNRAAKRTALTHTLFNLFGTVLFLALLPFFIKFVTWISPHVNLAAGVTEAGVIKRQIANAHTSFNTINTLIWLPLVGLMAWMVQKIIPGQDRRLERGVKYLDDHVLDNPMVALDLSAKEVTRMGTISQEMLGNVREAILKGNLSVDQTVTETEDELDGLKRAVINYLSVMTSRVSLTEKESTRLASLMQLAGDFERIGDHCLNIMELARYRGEENLPFSEQALAELDQVFEMVAKMLTRCTTALETENASESGRVLEMEENIDHEEEQLRKNHIERLNQGTCNPKSAVAYVELMKNLERIADHCNNVAEAVIRMVTPAA